MMYTTRLYAELIQTDDLEQYETKIHITHHLS